MLPSTQPVSPGSWLQVKIYDSCDPVILYTDHYCVVGPNQLPPSYTLTILYKLYSIFVIVTPFLYWKESYNGNDQQHTFPRANWKIYMYNVYIAEILN